MNIFKKFKTSIYDKWSSTEKLLFYLAIIAILISGSYNFIKKHKPIALENKSIISSDPDRTLKK